MTDWPTDHAALAHGLQPDLNQPLLEANSDGVPDIDIADDLPFPFGSPSRDGCTATASLAEEEDDRGQDTRISMGSASSWAGKLRPGMGSLINMVDQPSCSAPHDRTVIGEFH
jgi:hypothetical protein